MQILRSYLGFRRSLVDCRYRYRADRPAVVIGSGGMASVPAVLEAARGRIPIALFNPDAVPGRANRLLGSKAECVFAQFEETVAHFPRGVEVAVTGCPIRPEFCSATREAGLARFELDLGRKTLLVTGASLGARTVNQAVIANADFLAAQRDWQVLHLTGEADHEAVRQAHAAARSGAKVVAYTDFMAEAMAASDLVVSRAGASSLAEIMGLGRASVLMPYPFHRDQHQVVNARCLSHAGAARIVMDRKTQEANGPSLRAALEELMGSGTQREQMALAARKLGGSRCDAAREIASRLLMLAGVDGRSASWARRHETLKAADCAAR